jgi:hypothetical protein
MAEQDKKTAPTLDKKDAAKKTGEKNAAPKKNVSNVLKETRPVTLIDKYFAGAILFSIFVTAVGGFSARVSFNEVFYRCMVVSLSLWVVSIVIKKYCSLLSNFKRILDEMKKESAISAPSSEEQQ